MADNDNDELNEMMENRPLRNIKRVSKEEYGYATAERVPSDAEEKDNFRLSNVVQWSTGDDWRFIPSGKTKAALPPGFYNINQAPGIGIYFEKTPLKTEGLLRFPQANSDRVVSEISKFWNREEIFKQFKLVHKRGILLYGPPGSGKSCTIQLIMKDVVDREGIGVNFTNPFIFMEGIRLLRAIQPNTPVVVLMEDLDEILSRFSESDVLNVLDGVELLNKIVFIGTTNYPQELGPRIVNRPSRFDKRFKIGHPNEESRTIYLEHLFREHPDLRAKYDLAKWVADSEGFSLAHLKELFVAVVILEDDYEGAIKTLSSMKEKFPMGDCEDNNPIGFSPKMMGRRR